MEDFNDSSSSSQSNYGFSLDVRESSSYEKEKRASFPSFSQFKDDQAMKKFNRIRWKSGKSVDPRLFTMLGYFRELYEKRREFFKKNFPQLYDEFVDLYGGVPSKWDGVEARTVKRSLSFGSPRMSKQVDESTLRDERFKLTTPDFIYVGQGDQGVTNPTGSSEASRLRLES